MLLQLLIVALAAGVWRAQAAPLPQRVYSQGAVVALQGTPHLWIADEQGTLHYGGDTRALVAHEIDWSTRVEATLDELRAAPRGAPWLSAGLLQLGDPIYVVKWEAQDPMPTLYHIQSVADLELIGVDASDFGDQVFDQATWEQRYGLPVASLTRAELMLGIPPAGGTPNASATPTSTGTRADVTISVDRTAPVGVSQLAPGVTHTQYSLDSWGNAAAVSAAKQLLQASTVYQNQHIMGWGADNPEPSPGVYNWATLDARLALIRSTGGVPVITLCCSPDWMKGGSAGTTDWSKLEVAPTPAHYADFATLAQQVALRYPDVKYFQVWNEFKGFWNGSLNRWDYEGYTQFYNQIYDAVRAVRPDAQLGGPYVVLTSMAGRSAMSSPSAVSGPYGTLDQRPLDVISYWLANKHGAQFITVDAMIRNWADPQPADLFAATQKFADVDNWIRKQTNGGATLPIWWGEWYVTDLLGAPNETSPTDLFAPNQQNALMATALIQMATSGAAVPLRWQPQGVAGQAYAGDQEGQWSDTRVAGGGQPFPFHFTQQALKNSFGPGTALYRATASGPGVAALASASHTLLVNQRATPLAVNVGGTLVTLAPYEVRLL